MGALGLLFTLIKPSTLIKSVSIIFFSKNNEVKIQLNHKIIS
jgi:hypothetical protein